MKILNKHSLITLLLASIAPSQIVDANPTPAEVKAITQKVADWQMATYENMGEYRALPTKNLKRWHHRRRYTDVVWNAGTLYSGMLEWSSIADDPKYRDWVLNIGYRNDWRMDDHKTIFNADNHTVGYAWLSLYEQLGEKPMLEPLLKMFDEILKSPEKNKIHWTWCDALFMSPPVWARLAKVTQQEKYLNYMDQQYRLSYKRLWNAQDQLFHRDNGRKKLREKNSANQYWARGNGWVYGGLAYTLPYLPKQWEGLGFHLDLFTQMSEAIKRTQRSDGTWSMGMMGAEADYPVKEISGSAFFVFGMARGVNMGILDRATYEPVILKGWQALTECVREDGLVGYVQGVGAGPGESFPNYTEIYGTGAFLAAGSEIYKMLGGQDGKRASGPSSDPSSGDTLAGVHD